MLDVGYWIKTKNDAGFWIKIIDDPTSSIQYPVSRNPATNIQYPTSSTFPLSLRSVYVNKVPVGA